MDTQEGHADNFLTSTSSVSAADSSEASRPTDAVADSKHADSSRPTDEDILMQQNIIRADEAHKRPLVDALEKLSELRAEYLRGSDVFLRKIDNLERIYGSMRRTRGDGNCFFRGFIFGYLEALINGSCLEERDRFLACVRGWRGKLTSCGYQELVFEDAMDMLLDQVNAIGRREMDVSVLEGNFRDENLSNMIVMLLRMLASCEVQRRQDHFLPFIMGLYDDAPISVEQFCQRFVEPMGEESDHIQIVALTDALQVPIRVVYLDGRQTAASEDGLEVNSHDFVPDGSHRNDGPLVHLLYRPGHYDIIYPLQQ